VAPSTYPTQGGLERLHHEALSSILGTGTWPLLQFLFEPLLFQTLSCQLVCEKTV
jgi:hypothetical protein